MAGQTRTNTIQSDELRFAIPPSVTPTASEKAAMESGDAGSISLAQNGVLGTALTVNLPLSGTTTLGVDGVSSSTDGS